MCTSVRWPMTHWIHTRSYAPAAGAHVCIPPWSSVARVAPPRAETYAGAAFRVAAAEIREPR